VAETKDSQENIAYIRTHVDNLERMVRFQISANPQSRVLIEQALTRRPGMAEVYLALEDNPKTQDELKAKLNLSQPTVSRILNELFEAGMVEKIPSITDCKKQAYKWTDLEQMLNVSRLAKEHLQQQAKATSNTGKKADPASSSVSPPPVADDGASENK